MNQPIYLEQDQKQVSTGFPMFGTSTIMKQLEKVVSEKKRITITAKDGTVREEVIEKVSKQVKSMSGMNGAPGPQTGCFFLKPKGGGGVTPWVDFSRGPAHHTRSLHIRTDLISALSNSAAAPSRHRARVNEV